MKTKILFASMVLPTLFAACTAEDLVQNQNAGTALEGRALLSPLTINVSDETPTTRFSWNEATGGWNDFTANDKFSAGLVDGSGSVGDKVYTNYVYSSTDGVNYTTTSQMVEGVYMFYSYKGFETSASRSTVDFNLTAQTADLADPTKTVEGNQLFVTPLYDLEAENANDNLNMKFVSYWSTAAIKIQNASEAPFKIVRMVLNGSFAAKGFLSPDEMSKAGYVYTYDKDTQAFVLDAANAGEEGQKTYEDFLTAGIANVPSNANALVLDCGSYEVEAGKEVMAYMQVPAKKYDAGMTIDIVVETTDSKGASILKQLQAEVVANEMSSEKVTENDVTAMYRGQTTALFGYNDDKTPKAYKIDKIALLSAPDAAGAYASSFDDVYKYVTEADKSEHSTINKALEIYNIGDVKVDDEMVDLLSRMGVVVKFANPIDIELESTANTTVKNIVFAGDVTLKKGSITLGDNISVGVDATTDIPATLTINEGTSAKIAATAAADCNYKVATIVNNGTLELATASLEIAEVTNENADGETVGEIVVAESVTFNDATNAVNMGTAAKLTVNKEKTLTLTAQYVVAYGQEIINNGKITGTLTNHGTITNNAGATLSGVKNEGVAKSAADKNDAKVALIKNSGEIEAATLNHDSKVQNVTATASVAVTSATAATGGSQEAAALIDNTIGGIVTGTALSNVVVYAEYSGDQEGELGKVMACNKVIVKNGTWTDPKVYNYTNVVVELEGVTLTTTATGTGTGTTLAAIPTEFGSAKSIKMIGGEVIPGIIFAESATLKGVKLNGTVTFTNAPTSIDGCTFAKAVDTKGLASIKGATFNGAFTTSATTLDLTGVTFNSTIDGGSTLTGLNINIPATGESYSKTTTFNGSVTAANLNTLNINASGDVKAEMYVGLGASIGVAGTTVITNSGAIINYGRISGATSGSTPGKVTGNELTLS